MKETWKIINGLMKKASSLPNEFTNHNSVVISGKLNIANGFNNFFVNVGHN